MCYRIKLARIVSGLSVKEVAERLGMDVSDYRACEGRNGIYLLINQYLQQFAKMINFKLGFFFHDENNFKVKLCSERRSMSRRALLEIQTKVKDWYGDYTWLKDWSNVETFLGVPDYSRKIDTLFDLEKAAMGLVDRLSRGSRSALFLANLIEGSGHHVCFIDSDKEFDFLCFSCDNSFIVAIKDKPCYDRVRFCLDNDPRDWLSMHLTMFDRLVCEALTREEISQSKAAELLNRDIPTVRGLSAG
jgi:transcriptional regulator with XRE-family HTH domain